MHIRGLTDIGRARETNQDSFYVNNKGKWCIIADGMGGHNGGETASKLAVDIIRKTLDNKVTNIEDSIRTSIYNANKEIYELSLLDNTLSGMGTTVVLCYFNKNIATLANVGDSRAYYISNGLIKQVTTDHSIVQQLIECGTITPLEAKSHPQRNHITRAIGTEDIIEIDIFTVNYKKGDYIFLCSDGLTSFVDDETILMTIFNNNIDGAVRELIRLANNGGGTDNITAILIQI